MDHLLKLPGIAEWFPFEDRNRVKRTVDVLNDLNIHEFRLLFSWADWERAGGKEWFDYFVKEIGDKTKARLIPAMFYTPIDKAMSDKEGNRKTSHPPLNLSDYAKFVRQMIERYGKYFEWVQIWNEPNWKPYWEWDIDPDASLFVEMAAEAADVIHAFGKRAALGGLSPYEPEWITIMYKKGLLARIDAVGIHYSPSWDNQRRKWYGWETEIYTAKAHLKGINSKVQLWIAETGFSTFGNDQKETERSYGEQISFFEKTRKSKTDKILWYSVFDQNPDHKTDNEINLNTFIEQAAYHFGLITCDGKKKPLYDHWKKLAESKSNHGYLHPSMITEQGGT